LSSWEKFASDGIGSSERVENLVGEFVGCDILNYGGLSSLVIGGIDK